MERMIVDLHNPIELFAANKDFHKAAASMTKAYNQIKALAMDACQQACEPCEDQHTIIRQYGAINADLASMLDAHEFTYTDLLAYLAATVPIIGAALEDFHVLFEIRGYKIHYANHIPYTGNGRFEDADKFENSLDEWKAYRDATIRYIEAYRMREIFNGPTDTPRRKELQADLDAAYAEYENQYFRLLASPCGPNWFND